jgi:hypothetical protein
MVKKNWNDNWIYDIYLIDLGDFLDFDEIDRIDFDELCFDLIDFDDNIDDNDDKISLILSFVLSISRGGLLLWRRLRRE